ncbi:MAG: hypothetical protein MHMPM18_004715, partial [Marteilia pararefringens]
MDGQNAAGRKKKSRMQRTFSQTNFKEKLDRGSKLFVDMRSDFLLEQIEMDVLAPRQIMIQIVYVVILGMKLAEMLKTNEEDHHHAAAAVDVAQLCPILVPI